MEQSSVSLRGHVSQLTQDIKQLYRLLTSESQSVNEIDVKRLFNRMDVTLLQLQFLTDKMEKVRHMFLVEVLSN